ncbi:hypothetical protein [Dysgonomonas sp. 511]|uniref:hypothetical protein n=1 Tax=Dysgonomonas sp. 511 TaxID=2302930 RepID=UPI0013D3BC2B|nr:hypothetical protein [Dysgonomonas sp. 511]NDV78939.1 hypothetical protein [Dysgonomonas sp. 511]
MKKIILTTIAALLFVACGTYKSLDLNKLTTGMTKKQVEAVIGPPERILAVNDKQEGYQEVLEYRTSRDEVYALEFWNDYLTGYEFLYDDVQYVPSITPPAILPPYGRPIYVYPDYQPDRPSRPNRPNKPNRPNRPTPPNRPETSRPDYTRPTPGVGPSTNTRPAEATRPATDRTRPAR